MEAGIDLAKVRCMELQELKEETDKYARESASIKANLAKLNYQKQQLLLDLSLLRGYIALKTAGTTLPAQTLEFDSVKSMTHVPGQPPGVCSPAPVPAAAPCPPAFAHASMHASVTKPSHSIHAESKSTGYASDPKVQQPQKATVTSSPQSSQQEGLAGRPLTTVRAPASMAPSLPVSGTPPPLATLGSLESNVVKPDSISLTMDGLKVTRDVRATAQVAAPRGAKHGLRFGLSAFVESKRATLPEPSSAVGHVLVTQGTGLLDKPWNLEFAPSVFDRPTFMCSSRSAEVSFFSVDKDDSDELALNHFARMQLGNSVSLNQCVWSGTGDQLAAVACIGRKDHAVPAVIVADVSSMLEWSMIRPPADVAFAARKSCPTFEILSEVTIAVANGVFALATSYIGSMDCPVAVRVGGVPIRMLSGCSADSKLLGCAWVPQADSVVTCDSNKTLVLWKNVSTADEKDITRDGLPEHHTSSVECVTVAGNRFVLSGGSDGRVACWDLGSMQLVRSFAVGREAHAGAKRVEVFNVSSLQAHPVVDGVFVASMQSADSEKLEVLDLRVPIPVLTFPVPLDASVVTQRLRQHVPKWSSDGLSLAFGTPDSSVLLWDIRRPSAPMAAIGTPHVRPVTHATWLPESRDVFMTASLDRKISLQRLTFS